MSGHTRSQRLVREPAAVALVRGWLLATLLGVLMTALLIATGVFNGLPGLVESGFAVAGGWAITLLFAPWRQMLEIADCTGAVRQLIRQLEAGYSATRRKPLKDSMLQRGDEIGQLARLIDSVIADVIATRIDSQQLQRTLDDTVRRRTRSETAKLQRQVMTDPLTGLYNRRGIQAWVQEMLHDRRQRKMGILAIDMDHFKAVNDELGHPVGDTCLEFLGQVLKSVTRSHDCAARLGGDEFLVLMVDVDEQVLATVAERLQCHFGRIPWPYDGLQRPSLSIGAAADSVTELADIETLLQVADKELYSVRRAQRQRIAEQNPPQDAVIAAT